MSSNSSALRQNTIMSRTLRPRQQTLGRSNQLNCVKVCNLHFTVLDAANRRSSNGTLRASASFTRARCITSHHFARYRSCR